MKTPILFRVCFSSVFFFALGLSGASAQSTTWTNGNSTGNWSDAGNWNNGLPSKSNQARFLDGSLPDAPISVNVDTTTPAGPLNFATTGSRSVTIGGGTLYLQSVGNATILWNTTSSTVPITINSNIDFSSDTASTGTVFNIGMGQPVTFNGNIGISGTGSRGMQSSGTSIIIINGSNAADNFNFGGTGELIAGSTTALGTGAVQKSNTSTLSLRSDVTIGGGTYSWLQQRSSSIRISEVAPSSASRTITMNNRVAASDPGYKLTFANSINSTGSLTLELKYSGGTAQNLDLITNNTAIVRFAQTGNTTYSGNITGTGRVEKTAGAGTTTLSGNNTYTGDTYVSSGTLLLNSSGKLNFLIGATSEANNRITGTGTGNVSLDGTFTFDLTGAGTTPGDHWLIVDDASLGTVSYTGNFAVQGFTNGGGGNWTQGNYTFSQTTGMLTVIPEPSAFLLLCVGGMALLSLQRRRG